MAPDDFIAAGEGRFPGFVGVRISSIVPGAVEAELDVQTHHLAPNDYLHAAVVVALADTACGYGAMVTLPEGASHFTTVELKTNFLATVLTGLVRCSAEMIHGGRSTQVWDATVVDPQRDRTLALFRCTQLIVYPR